MRTRSARSPDAGGRYQCRADDGVDRPDGEIGRACTNPRTATVDSSSTRRALPIVRSRPTASPRSSDSNLLELSATGAHRPQLPSFSPAAGKRLTSDGKSQPSEGVMYSMAPKQVMMPVSPVGGYHLDGAVGGFKVSFLVDTGAAVTLLRKDTSHRRV